MEQIEFYPSSAREWKLKVLLSLWSQSKGTVLPNWPSNKLAARHNVEQEMREASASMVCPGRYLDLSTEKSYQAGKK